MNLIDTHCHLNFKAFKEDYIEVSKRSFEHGVKKIIIVGSDYDTSKDAVIIAHEINDNLNNNFAHCAVGIHPTHFERGKFKLIEELAKDELVLAIGETGLDFFHDQETEAEQLDLFDKHIKLAQKLNKPLIIHSRMAEQAVIEILKKSNYKNGVFHCFSGNHRQAQEIVEMGMMISFTGNITYGNKKLKKVIERTPLEKIMIETDAPYIVPEPLRSAGEKRCEPYFAKETAAKIAKIKEIQTEEVLEATTKNAVSFFNL